MGLQRGFLDREGELALRFAPPWPWQEAIGAASWNALLIAAAALLVVMIYRREGRTRRARIGLGLLRGTTLGLVILLLNRPMLTLEQSRIEPSVLAVLVDDSISMRVPDAGGNTVEERRTRLRAATELLEGDQQGLLADLARKHQIRLYRFGQDVQALGAYTADPGGADANAAAVAALGRLEPQGQNTQLIAAIGSVLQELAGQRLAGVVVLTDGRQTPSEPVAAALEALKSYGVKIYPVVIGSERAPRNLDLAGVSVQEAAFVGDIVNVKAQVRATGYEPGHPIDVELIDKRTGQPLLDGDGAPAQRTVGAGEQPVEVEAQFMPTVPGTVDVAVRVVPQPGELDDQDNVRTVQVAVLEAKIAVLYVDGYPRWDYRYIKNEMIRDKTVEISCLLTSADPSFAQEGDRPIQRFPESIEELLDYDVVLLGDVDPRQFTDAQLQMIGEFVAEKGGGFGMVAGPRWSPRAYRNTAIEPLLPVLIGSAPMEAPTTIAQGFRPVVTRQGHSGSIFRFFADRERNQRFLAEEWQPVFWYCRDIIPKPGVGEVYAEHPTETGPDGRKAPILVMGRFGAGRTMFSAIDDSWRWRFYTGESVFDTYWVQQLRYLARGRKIGQRRAGLSTLRPGYELGEQIVVHLRILDPQLLRQLPDQIRVQVTDEHGEVVGRPALVRQDPQGDLYVAAWMADRIGQFTFKLPSIAGGVDAMELPLAVAVPRLELVDARVDRALPARLASATLGQSVDPSAARRQLPELISSAAKIIPQETTWPLWNAPIALALFAALLTAEWILRKAQGLL